MRFLAIILAALYSIPSQAGKTFEIFDGQFYNGQYYPLIDIIEWGEQRGELPHMEFHLHSKDKRIELVAVPDDKNGKPVLYVMYDLKFRSGGSEHVCRHVLAPSHFKKGMKMYAYRDEKDPDYDNVYISSQPIKGLPEYKMPTYQACPDENASNMPDATAMATETTPERVPASAGAPAAEAAPSPKKDNKNIGVDYENSAVPFSF